MAAKKKNFFATIGSAVFLLVIALGVFVYVNFGDLTKRAAEKIASDALGVRVQISSIHVSLKEKEAVVSNIRVGNPPGYKKRHAITVEKISIGLNTASRELIDFNDIKVEGSVVNLEVTEKGTNLTDLKKLAAQKPQRESVGSEQVRVIVQNMVIGASTLNPSVTMLGRDMASVKIPSINLSGIGRREKGVLAREAITQIVTKYINVAQKEANQAGMLKGIEGEVGEVEEAVDNIKKDFKKIFD